ncbi:MAG: hypothetical protein NXI20_18380 [bacterium]|nr:hypothetical protein [bacterium]
MKYLVYGILESNNVNYSCLLLVGLIVHTEPVPDLIQNQYALISDTKLVLDITTQS